MATFKGPGIPDITGDFSNDISNIYAYIQELESELQYALNNIDSENISSDLLKKIGSEE